MKRVVVTGVGAVTACGIGADALWNAAHEGRTGVGPVHFPELARQMVNSAAMIAASDMDRVWAGARPRLQDQVSALALAAAREAVSHARLDEGDFGHRCGVVVGSGYGGAQTSEINMTLAARDPGARADPMCIPKVMTSAPASWIGMEFGATGPTWCVSTACASGTQSIGLAFQMIRSGMVDRVLAGGSEALLVPNVFRAWELMRVMSAKACRPFSKGRDGMVLGDGAAVVVLESLDAALARGADILCEVSGFGTTGDADDLLRPSPDGAAGSMLAALADAGLSPGDIGYVNAHGTGTIINDKSETEALRMVFGEQLADVAVSSTKPIHGHALGAAGAIEFVITVAALRARMAPPTINFLEIDDKLGIDPVANVARPFSRDACLSNSFAFGGINATLALKGFVQ